MNPAHGTLVPVQHLLNHYLNAARTANPRLRVRDLTAVTVECEAPYAKEKRLLLSSIAHQHNVLSIGIPRGENGNYRAGYDVDLIGFSSLVRRTREAYGRASAHAVTAMLDTPCPHDEDLGTFRSSFLLGYRLGLTDRDLTREEVQAEVSGPHPTDRGVTMRSTGSGAWAGYRAARDRAVAPALTAA